MILNKYNSQKKNLMIKSLRNNYNNNNKLKMINKLKKLKHLHNNNNKKFNKILIQIVMNQIIRKY